VFTQPIPFGKYFLLDRVNVGGMAEVFKAKTFGVEGFERLLAVKRILPNIAEDSEFIEMFVDEAKIAVELHHANIAQIYDLGKVDGSYFIALEYIHGKDLRAIFDRTRKLGEALPIPMACYSVMKICEGIDYAHNKRDQQGREMGLVHRDISPQNILVSYEGEVKIIDFGIAKAANKASKTQAGILKGKFGYMSPEQVRGLPLDRRSDIFSVGIVLYELLTGERLFLGESDFSTLEKVRNVEIMPPTLHNPKIPEDLEAIVFKALAKNVDERYENAIDLHDDLQRFLYSINSLYSRKDLSQYMKRAFSEELARENAQLEAFRRMPPPSGAFQDVQSTQGNNLPPLQPEGAQGQSRRNPAAQTLPPNIPPTSRRTPPPSSYPNARPASEPPGMPPLPNPSSPFQSGFVGMIPSKPSNGSTQVLAEDDLIESDDSNAFFPNGRPKITPPPQSTPKLDDSGRFNPRTPSGHSSPRLEPVRAGELLPPEAIPPATSLSPGGTGGSKTLLVLLGGVAALALLALVGYFLFAKPARGTLVILATPADARILIDGEPRAETSPASLLLPVGKHKVSVEQAGYTTASQEVEIVEGKSQTLNISLQAGNKGTPSLASGSGKLYVDSEPPGAQIFIDEVLQESKTPTLLEGLPTGTHNIRVVPANPSLAPFVAAGYEITTDAKTPLKARFETARGTLSVTSDPSGAQVSVLIPGEKRPVKAVTPATIPGLPLNVDLDVFIEKSGLPRVARRISLSTSEPTPLSVRLNAGESSKPNEPNEPAKPPTGPTEPAKPPTEPVKVETPKPADGPGTVTIGATPSCEVLLDGKSIGYTPKVKFETKAGSHSLRLKNEKFGIDFSTTITVTAGENTKFHRRFDVPAEAPAPQP
jgi:serine/threonine protein kinase